ncbi:MAG: anthranilate synthase component I family protein [Actinomycetes bacterium]
MLAGSVLRRLDPVEDLAVVRDGAATVIALDPVERLRLDGTAALDALARLQPGWWAGALAYELGRVIEPGHRRTDRPQVPELLLTRFAARLVLEPQRPPRLEGTGPGRDRLVRALESARAAVDPTGLRGPWRSGLSRAEFEAAVREIIELERAGECYQANLTRTLTCGEPADPVALFDALDRHNPAPHAALLRTADLAVVSASPERFLRIEGRRVETRPIKGTARDAADLLESTKDRAENVMIVDLARNDLGRVCEYGSVTVPALCALEPHPGLHHLVSTVTGTLTPGTDLGDLLRATFPPASVTGAPKPRVLEVIERLEPEPRGYYCGAIGWIDTERQRADLAVAIRTFTVAEGHTTFGTGAGITVGSDPRAEWVETELKASRLLAAATGTAPARVGVPS